MLPIIEASRSRCARIVREISLGSIVVSGALLVTSCAYALSWRAGAPPLRASAASHARHAQDKVQRTAANRQHSTAGQRAPKAEQHRTGDANEEACYADLSDAGVTFQRVAKSSVPGVAW